MNGADDMISGISHITYIVKDLDLATKFFEGIFAGKLLYSSGDTPFSLSEERFLQIGDTWVCIMKGEPLPQRTYNHTAFKISENEFDDHCRRIQEMGIDILPGRSRLPEEGRSIYFYDFDNHLFELHTGTLAQRLERYGKE